jgi:hypothetical protein
MIHWLCHYLRLNFGLNVLPEFKMCTQLTADSENVVYVSFLVFFLMWL